MFPSTYTWTAVLTSVTSFLSEPLVAGGTLLAIALPFGVKLVRSAKAATSAR